MPAPGTGNAAAGANLMRIKFPAGRAPARERDASMRVPLIKLPLEPSVFPS